MAADQLAADDLRQLIKRRYVARECPVCEADLPTGYAMCRRCWRQVPRELKSLVRRSARRGTFEDWLDAMCQAMHAVEVAE